MIFHIATLLFVLLKVFGHIAWSWWLVFAPSIFIIVFGLAVFVFAALVAAKER